MGGECRTTWPAEFAARNVVVHEQTEIAAIYGNRHIEEIDLKNGSATSRLPCSAVFVFIGAEPSAEWLPAQMRATRRDIY